MGHITIKKYSEDLRLAWDNFNSVSRNGVFLFNRDFMEYHSDRFIDNSLLFFKDKELKAIFPANICNDKLISHQGLTFGSLVYGLSTKAIDIDEAINELITYCKKEGLKEIIFKPTPTTFHRFPASEDLYFWHQKGARLYRRDLSSIVPLTSDHKYSKGRKWIINKAEKSGIYIQESQNIEDFHRILKSVLEKFEANPVHTSDELRLLQSRFPNYIRLIAAFNSSKMLAGAIIFDYGEIRHTQYLANSDEGKEIGAMDLLIHELIEMSKHEGFRYLSFGISTTNEGIIINQGLLNQKESFGGKGVVHDWYSFQVPS